MDCKTTYPYLPTYLILTREPSSCYPCYLTPQTRRDKTSSFEWLSRVKRRDPALTWTSSSASILARILHAKYLAYSSSTHSIRSSGHVAQVIKARPVNKRRAVRDSSRAATPKGTGRRRLIAQGAAGYRVQLSAHRLDPERDVSPAVTASTPGHDRETLHVAFSR